MIQLVARGIIHHKGKILLVRNLNQDFWCLPGGKVNPDESIEQGLRRELSEELGAIPRIGSLLYVQQLFKDSTQRVEFFFLIKNAEDFAEIDFAKAVPARELSEIKFAKIDQAHVLPEFLKKDLANFESINPVPSVRFKIKQD